MAIVSQEPVLFSTTIYESILHGLVNTEYADVSDDKKMELIEKAAKIANAHDFIMDLPEKYQTKVGERGGLLSGGQKQRVALASVLALQPKIIILDEATAMLDPDGRATVMETLQKLKKQFGKELTLVTITHDMDEATLADRVVVINDGQKILDGTPAEVFSQRKALHENGLELPFANELAFHLNEKPNKYMDERELIQWLSTLNK